MPDKPKVLIAGIGGASLGTEILKCLQLANRYIIFGCDISRYAFGHYSGGFEETFIVPSENYCSAVLEYCLSKKIRAVIPGGEEPLRLLSQNVATLKSANIYLAANSPAVANLCSDKAKFFASSHDAGIPIPKTAFLLTAEVPQDTIFPCIVKPASGTGGSSLTFLANDRTEAQLYVSYILADRDGALLQEYLPEDEGEFTIGVLSLPDGRIAGSLALRRFFNAKLSVLSKTKAGIVSSGYSQGYIDDFPSLRAQSEEIALKIGSVGPINVQGRVRNGVLFPFEVNPRFSASTYLRALAGFNELDAYLQWVFFQTNPQMHVKRGYAFRSLSEVFVEPEDLVG